MTDSVWMIRAGNGNELIETFLDDSLAAVGWAELGDLSDCTTRDAIKERYASVYEKRKQGRVNTDSAQLHMLVNRIDEGDVIVTYDKDSREYHVGDVTGPYQFDEIEDRLDYPHLRPVDWDQETISRDDFSQAAQNVLGGAMTVFSLENCEAEIVSHRRGEPTEEPAEPDDAPPFIEEVESRSEELISDIVADIDPYDLEDLVAAVLRAMGYTAQTTQKGPDYGVDVVAHPDALGFEDPHIKVQVKHTKDSISNSSINQFLGTVDEGQHGLFVSTGGYTSPAVRQANLSGKTITLLDRDDFIDLLLEHYDDLEQEYKSMVPLKQVYIPTEGQ